MTHTAEQHAASATLRGTFDQARADAFVGKVLGDTVGLATTVDAIVQPSVVWLRAPGQSSKSGLGDTNFDGKWRFWGSDPWSFAIRAGVLAPTSQKGLGLRHGDVSEHALLVATWDDSPTTVHANLGLTRVPRAPGTRASVAHVSAALMQQMNERLILTVDGELDQDPSASRKTWPGSLLGGVIWTARPGLDLDIGWQRSFNAQPVDRQWMAGLTWRFSL